MVMLWFPFLDGSVDPNVEKTDYCEWPKFVVGVLELLWIDFDFLTALYSGDAVFGG
jgi:hypothetical protein